MVPEMLHLARQLVVLATVGIGNWWYWQLVVLAAGRYNSYGKSALTFDFQHLEHISIDGKENTILADEVRADGVLNR